MSKGFLILILCCTCLLLPFPAAATEYMEVLGPGPLMNDTTLWFEITGDMPGCDNTSGYWNQNGDLVGGTGYDNIDCWEWSSTSPRAVDQDCGTGNCTVSATVYCPPLNMEGPYPWPSRWITFTCSGSATDGVRSGDLGGPPQRKGVRCGDVECGCVEVGRDENNLPLWGWWGSSSPIGGNFSNRVCQ